MSASNPDRVIFMHKAKRSTANFSPSLNIMQTVLRLGPSMAGLGRLPVLILISFDSFFGSFVIAISKHISFSLASI
jgi:hypothetical protein